MGFLPFVECHAFLPEGLSVGSSWNTTCSWDLNQASCSWPPSGDSTRHLQACAGGLGQILPDPAFLFVVFLSSNDWRKWVNSAFRKTPLFKNCRCERLSLLYIFKIEIYNPLSALLLTLVCHFYHVLLRVAIFVLNVAIATYFQRRQKELSTKTLLWKIYRCKVVQFFTEQPLLWPEVCKSLYIFYRGLNWSRPIWSHWNSQGWWISINLAWRFVNAIKPVHTNLINIHHTKSPKQVQNIVNSPLSGSFLIKFSSELLLQLRQR